MSTGKREGVLPWDDYFMGIAFMAAKRSKDPVTQVGACIVDKRNVVVGVGYNGMPRGCSDDVFPWTKNKLDGKKFYVCHAELNAILNKNCANLEGCKIYVGLFPCNECAKCIIQSGIREVIYFSDKHEHKNKTEASKRMLKAADVKVEQFVPQKQKIVIDFDEINKSEETAAKRQKTS